MPADAMHNDLFGSVGRVCSPPVLAAPCADAVLSFTQVHATIPFIAMLRKAVVMPKWAIAYTVGSAVLGQIMGARLERQRMQSEPDLLLPTLPGVANSAGRQAQQQSAWQWTCREDSVPSLGMSTSAVAAF